MSLQSSHLFCLLESDFRVASQLNGGSRHPARGKAVLSHSNVQTVGCDEDHRLLIASHQALSTMPAEGHSQTCCQANHCFSAMMLSVPLATQYVPCPGLIWVMSTRCLSLGRQGINFFSKDVLMFLRRTSACISLCLQFAPIHRCCKSMLWHSMLHFV